MRGIPVSCGASNFPEANSGIIVSNHPYIETIDLSLIDEITLEKRFLFGPATRQLRQDLGRTYCRIDATTKGRTFSLAALVDEVFDGLRPSHDVVTLKKAALLQDADVTASVLDVRHHQRQNIFVARELKTEPSAKFGLYFLQNLLGGRQTSGEGRALCDRFVKKQSRLYTAQLG